jgi:Domain of unknown function (DUF4349)
MRHPLMSGLAISAIVVGLAACSKEPKSEASSTETTTADTSSAANTQPRAAQHEAAADMAMTASGKAERGTDAPASMATAGSTPDKTASLLPIPAAVQLAYRYVVQLEVPTESVASVARSHQRECEAAGPVICQVLGATENINDDIAAAELTLRAQPQWLTKFRDTVLTSAKENKGRVVHTNTETEDMSAQMVDTEAYLQARKILRARLLEQLKTEGGNSDELFGLREQIDDIQQEIDTTKSRLENLQNQVVMANMTVNYQSPGAIITVGTFDESRSAVQQSVSNFATSLHVLVQIFGFVLPWALLGGASYYAFRKIRRKLANQVSPTTA